MRERQGARRPARLYQDFIFLPVFFPRTVHFRLKQKTNILCAVEFFEGKFRSEKLKHNYITSTKGRSCAKLMNNPNPFLPQGSLLEQQAQRRSRLKLGVFCVLAVSVTGLVTMLIQGCQRHSPEQDVSQPSTPDTTNAFAADTNFPPMTAYTNTVGASAPSSVPAPGAGSVAAPGAAPTTMSLPPIDTPAPAVAPTAAAPVGGSEYTVVKGDSLAKIAKKNGVSTKALQDANPGVQPTKLKPGQKLTIPAGGKTLTDSAAPASTLAGSDFNSTATTYTVKPGDTLIKIAKAHGVSVNALKAANGLSTTKISVGKKLKIPAKSAKASKKETMPEATAPAPESIPTLPPVSTPSPSTAPATPTNH
jgi:LysM repeat protein